MKKWLREYLLNFCYLMFTFGSGVFYFCYYLVGLVFGFSMSFTLIGIPVLTFVMRTSRTFMNYDRIQAKFYMDITIEPVMKRTSSGSYWNQAKVELSDIRNWKAVSVLMLKIIIGIISLFSAVIFFIVPILWILAPWISSFANINMGPIRVDTLPKSLLMMVIGLLFAFAGVWAAKGAARWTARYTQWMFSVWR
ncbi:sensor domain-containing protein [Paenibacillus sp. NPDC093718]|uniref:sensor domain-containing protein n=1 Tax=Paenibacillus sp. NPDC093718 TaxID=3390601 RepID=UPI003D05AA08